MKLAVITFMLLTAASSLLYSCTNSSGTATATESTITSNKYGGYASQQEWGKHLVIISGCNDCHSPKVTTAQGPVVDAARALSGSPSPALLPSTTPEEASKGTAATMDMTAWIGPWGKSYAANITSDSTGIGNWTEQQFIDCLRNGIYKGLAGTRALMPPMPWQDFKYMTDDEIKAIFAYLKSTTPIHNIVPQYEPLVMVKK